MAKRRTLDELEEAWMLAGLESIAAHDRRGLKTSREAATDENLAAQELVEALALAIVRRPAEATAWATRFRRLRRQPWHGAPWMSDAYKVRLLEVLDR